MPLTTWAGQTIRIVIHGRRRRPDSLVEAGDRRRPGRAAVRDRVAPRISPSTRGNRIAAGGVRGRNRRPAWAGQPRRATRCGNVDIGRFRTRPLDGGPRPLPGGHPDARLRRADRPERGRQPAPDDDPRRLPRRRRALRHRVPVRRRRRRVRLDHARCRAIPTSVVKGGDWTLQRLIRETDAAAENFALRPPRRARPPRRRGAHEGQDRRPRHHRPAGRRGRHRRVGQGPRLPAPARRARGPRLLRRSAARSSSPPPSTPMRPQARGQQLGDGTPVHITIPTDNPWVPLRILALGKTGDERVQADVYLLTDRAPALLPAPTGDERASGSITAQPASREPPDRPPHRPRAWSWVPSSAWLTKVAVDGDRRPDRLRPRDRRVRRRPPVGGRCRVRRCRARRVARPLDLSRLLLALAFVASG